MGRVGRKQDRLDASDRIIKDADELDLALLQRNMCGGASPENSYALVSPIGHRKRYAQFFTPPKIAKFMAEWVVSSETRSVLDPAIGMGVLARAAQDMSQHVVVTAFEKDPVILRAFLGTEPDLLRTKTVLADFLTAETSCNFDGMLMNPPYLRHHDMDYQFDIFGIFSERYGVEISGLSNSYLLFTLKAISALRVGGRGAIIIPTEWMNANFGSAMKNFLLRGKHLKEIIYFSNCSEVFEDALTTACVLLIEKATA